MADRRGVVLLNSSAGIRHEFARCLTFAERRKGVNHMKRSQLLLLGVGLAVSLMGLPAHAGVKSVWVGVDGAT